jgi:hypothetical protein
MFFSSSKGPYRFWGSNSLLFNICRGCFPGVKRPVHEFDQSIPSSVKKVKKEWNYSSTPPTCLHGLIRDTFTVILVCAFVCVFCFHLWIVYCVRVTGFVVNILINTIIIITITDLNCKW